MKRPEAQLPLRQPMNLTGFFHRVLVLTLIAFGTLPGRAEILPGQPLAVAHFDLGSGTSSYATNSMRLQLGYFSPDDGLFNTAPLFNQFELTNGSAGQVFLLTPDNDPDFALFRTILSNGDNNGLGLGGLEAIRGYQETEFFDWVVPGGNGIDLQGFPIGAIEMRLSRFDFASPGSDPNNDGRWTEASYAGTFTVYAVPEPATGGLLLLGGMAGAGGNGFAAPSENNPTSSVLT